MTACDLCLVLDPAATDGPLQRHLRPGQSHLVAGNEHAAAFPTIGAYVPGYVLIVPRVHGPSLGQLGRDALRGVEDLTTELATRITGVYGGSVLGFEYGLNRVGARRIEHAHLHLLPTAVDLRAWLSVRLRGYDIDSLTDLPSTRDHSYITVWQPPGRYTVYPVPNDAAPRIRPRQVVADLDERVDVTRWDWETAPHGSLIRQTVDDLTAPAFAPAGRDAR